MARRRRTMALVTSSEALAIVEESIESINNFFELAGDAFGDYEEKLKARESLQDLISELTWRYGASHVRFKFSQKRKFSSTQIQPLSNFLLDSADHPLWVNRVFIEENLEDDGITKVYIRF